MRVYNGHFVFIATAVSLSSGTSRNTGAHFLDYLYGARRSLPRREKCTLDAAKPLCICNAYTMPCIYAPRTHPHSGRVRLFLTRPRACRRYVLWIRLHTCARDIGMHRVRTRDRYAGVCAPRPGNLARNCRKETRRGRKLVRRARRIRPETPSDAEARVCCFRRRSSNRRSENG